MVELAIGSECLACGQQFHTKSELSRGVSRAVSIGIVIVVIVAVAVVAFGFQATPGQEVVAVEVIEDVPPDLVIELSNYDFSEVDPQFSAGTVVEYRNVGGSHTVTLDAEGVDVVLPQGSSLLLRFNESGTFEVYCRFHGSPRSDMHSTTRVG